MSDNYKYKEKNNTFYCEWCDFKSDSKSGIRVHQSKKHGQYLNGGRKMFDGRDEEEVISKLEQIFKIGGTDKEACLHAEISVSSLYRYENKNPEFRERKEQLKQTPKLRARKTLFDSLTNPKDARWYLKHKANSEFSERVENTYPEDQRVNIKIVDAEPDEEDKDKGD